MIGELGEEYVISLRHAYAGRVPGGADLVTYWFEKHAPRLRQVECTRLVWFRPTRSEVEQIERC